MTDSAAGASVPVERVALLGGTFNPVHYGHLSVASQVAWFLDAPVHLVLSARPPHRKGVASAGQRWEMLQLAVNGFDRLLPDRRELDRDGPSYMVDTLNEFRRQFPEAGVSLVLGSDAAAGLASWHRSEQLARLGHLLIVRRPGMASDLTSTLLAELGFKVTDDPGELARPSGGLSCFMDTVALEISASAIRDLVGRGGPIDFMTPPAVVEYVSREGLYLR